MDHERWNAPRFRGLLASHEPRLSIRAFRDRLLETVENGAPVPSVTTIYSEWYRSRGYGPRSDALVEATAETLGCTSEDLLCSPKQTHNRPD